MFCNLSPRRMFLPRTSFQNIGFNMVPSYVTSSYSNWIFCRGVSDFATDFPCGVWCRGLTTCLLHVGPPFGNRLLNNSWAEGLTWRVYLHFFYFDICNCIYLNTSYHFSALSLLLEYCSLFFKYSCTNIFHRRSLYIFYTWKRICIIQIYLCISHAL